MNVKTLFTQCVKFNWRKDYGNSKVLRSFITLVNFNQALGDTK